MAISVCSSLLRLSVWDRSTCCFCWAPSRSRLDHTSHLPAHAVCGVRAPFVSRVDRAGPGFVALWMDIVTKCELSNPYYVFVFWTICRACDKSFACGSNIPNLQMERIFLADDSKRKNICCYTKDCAENQVRQRQRSDWSLKKKVNRDAGSAHPLLSPPPTVAECPLWPLRHRF